MHVCVNVHLYAVSQRTAHCTYTDHSPRLAFHRIMLCVVYDSATLYDCTRRRECGYCLPPQYQPRVFDAFRIHIYGMRNTPIHLYQNVPLPSNILHYCELAKRQQGILFIRFHFPIFTPIVFPFLSFFLHFFSRHNFASIASFFFFFVVL